MTTPEQRHSQRHSQGHSRGHPLDIPRFPHSPQPPAGAEGDTGALPASHDAMVKAVLLQGRGRQGWHCRKGMDTAICVFRLYFGVVYLIVPFTLHLRDSAAKLALSAAPVPEHPTAPCGQQKLRALSPQGEDSDGCRTGADPKLVTGAAHRWQLALGHP